MDDKALEHLLRASRVACVLAAITLAGCATTGTSAPGRSPGAVDGPVQESMVIEREGLFATDEAVDPRAEEAAEIPEAAADKPAYRIAPGDVLAFRSFDDETINVEQAVVRYDGCLSLPLIEDVNVQGTTREEALEAVRTAYESVFKDPQLDVTVVTASGQQYYVMGDVNRPAEYPYRRPVNVLQAINTAGGIRDRSRATGESYVAAQGTLSVAYVIRHYRGERNVIECDLKGLTNSGPHPSELSIWPDDVVYVPEGVNLVYIVGAVVRPSVFTLVEGETLLQVLARSGGLIESIAHMRHVVVIRNISESHGEVMLVDVKKTLKTGKDMELRGGDIVYVPRKPLVRLQEFVNRFTGSFIPLMTLYRDAYETYYTDKRFDLLFEGADAGTAGTLSVLEGLRDLGYLFR